MRSEVDKLLMDDAFAFDMNGETIDDSCNTHHNSECHP